MYQARTDRNILRSVPFSCMFPHIITSPSTGVKQAIDTARAELVAFKKSSLKNSTDENYKNMLNGMYDYLTRKYDVGKGLHHHYSLR